MGQVFGRIMSERSENRLIGLAHTAIYGWVTYEISKAGF